jgi:hypothetical protein
MTKLFLTTTVSRPAATSRVSDDEPTALELQRWEDDGGAVPPDRPPKSPTRRRFTSSAFDQVAA